MFSKFGLIFIFDYKHIIPKFLNYLIKPQLAPATSVFFRFSPQYLSVFISNEQEDINLKYFAEANYKSYKYIYIIKAL